MIWDPVACTLDWSVELGHRAGHEFTPLPTEKKKVYRIYVDDSVMSVNGDRREFSREEAIRVHQFLNVLTQYSETNTEWWEKAPPDPEVKPPLNSGGAR